MKKLPELDIKKCARCGGDHNNLPLKEFVNPISCGGEYFTHWCICPNLNEPILVRITVSG